MSRNFEARYVPVKRIQAVFGVSRSTVYRLAAKGKLTIHRFADSVPLVSVEEMEGLMTRKEIPGGDDDG